MGWSIVNPCPQIWVAHLILSAPIVPAQPFFMSLMHWHRAGAFWVAAPASWCRLGLTKRLSQMPQHVASPLVGVALQNGHVGLEIQSTSNYFIVLHVSVITVVRWFVVFTNLLIGLFNLTYHPELLCVVGLVDMGQAAEQPCFGLKIFQLFSTVATSLCTLQPAHHANQQPQ